jgi:hypothetical protein
MRSETAFFSFSRDRGRSKECYRGEGRWRDGEMDQYRREGGGGGAVTLVS